MPPANAITALPRPRYKKWSNAVPTEIDGKRFPSKTEARVWCRLRDEVIGTLARLYRKPRFPLFNLAPDDNGIPYHFDPDFVLIYPNDEWRVIDAKSGKRRSPEWMRGKAAFEAEYLVKVEEVSK